MGVHGRIFAGRRHATPAAAERGHSERSLLEATTTLAEELQGCQAQYGATMGPVGLEARLGLGEPEGIKWRRFPPPSADRIAQCRQFMHSLWWFVSVTHLWVRTFGSPECDD